MKAGHKFLLGAALIVGSVGFLIAEGVKETGVYFLTPAELAAKTAADPTFVENVGFKVGAKVVPGSVRRDNASRTIDFQVSDGVKTYPVTYHGLVPDTFTDANDIEVVVEGRLGRRRRHPRHRRARQVRLALRGRAESLSISMTLLGQFALWAAFLLGLWGVAIALFGQLAGPAGARRQRDPLGLRRVRLPGGRLDCALEGPHLPRLQHRIRGGLHQPEPAAVLHLFGVLGRSEGVAPLLGRGALALRQPGAAAHRPALRRPDALCGRRDLGGRRVLRQRHAVRLQPVRAAAASPPPTAGASTRSCRTWGW